MGRNLNHPQQQDASSCSSSSRVSLPTVRWDTFLGIGDLNIWRRGDGGDDGDAPTTHQAAQRVRLEIGMGQTLADRSEEGDEGAGTLQAAQNTAKACACPELENHAARICSTNLRRLEDQGGDDSGHMGTCNT
eukprot:5428534-Amphidinium_carterae.2